MVNIGHVIAFLLGIGVLFLIYSTIIPPCNCPSCSCPPCNCPSCPVCPSYPGDLKLGTKFVANWGIVEGCYVTIEYAVANHGDKAAQGVVLNLKAENPALGKVRDEKNITIGNMASNAAPAVGTENLKYLCEDDIVKITATVRDASGRSDVQTWEKRKEV